MFLKSFVLFEWSFLQDFFCFSKLTNVSIDWAPNYNSKHEYKKFKKYCELNKKEYLHFFVIDSIQDNLYTTINGISVHKYIEAATSCKYMFERMHWRLPRKFIVTVLKDYMIFAYRRINWDFLNVVNCHKFIDQGNFFLNLIMCLINRTYF